MSSPVDPFEPAEAPLPGNELEPDVLDTPEAGPRLIRGIGLRTAGYALGILVGIVSSAVALRYLGVVASGRLITVLALVAIAAGISDLGLSSLALREYAILKGKARDEAMRNLLGLRLTLGVAGILGATLFALVADYPQVMVAGTMLAGTALIGFVIQQTLAVPLSIDLRLGWVTACMLLSQLGAAVGIIVLSLVDAELIAFFAVQTVAIIPVILLAYVLARGAIPVRPAMRPRAWAGIMRDVAPYAVAVVFYVLYFRFAVIAVSLLSTEEETGYYGASFRVIDVLAALLPLLASSAFPLLARAARDDRERLHYAIGRLSHGVLILGAWLAVALGLGASLAIDVVAGPGFEPAVDPLRIQAFALIGTSLLAVWGYGLLSLTRHRAIMLANLGTLVVAGALSLVLVPRYGAIGAAIGLTVAELGLAAAYGLALMRAEPALVRSLGVIPRILVAAALALAVPIVLDLGDLLAVIVGTAVYVLALFLLRAFPAELKGALVGRVNPPAA